MWSRGPRFAGVLDSEDAGGVGRGLRPSALAFDIVLALVFIGLGAVLLTVLAQHEKPVDYLFVIAQCAPVALRRRFPKAALGLVYAVALIQAVSGVLIGMYNAAVPFALYTAVGYTGRRFGRTALAGGLALIGVGAATDWWRWIDQQLTTGELWLRPFTTVGMALVMVAAWALGERLRSARWGRIALAERADRLLREREQQAALAAAAERARIAREMHDVIAHGLSVMIAQADGAAYVVEQSPTMAKKAVEQISVTGREALAQMRDLLGLLRTDGESAGARPQPDLADLDGLVEQVRDGGAEVSLVRGEPGPLPALVSLTAYRIVQEGLTNARKYGGPPMEVSVTPADGGLAVTVRDAGRSEPAMTDDGPGYGLLGMRERVLAVGGTLTAGPTAAGGFEIAAWLPLPNKEDDA